MSKGFIVSEETPDRNYFTIVPNYIVNHSTIYEQGIYLVMKRIAGENGTCFASHQTIADQCGVSRPTVSKTIKKLLKRAWLKETGIKIGKTLSTKQYQIVDLWELNNKFYREQKIRQPQNTSIKEEAVNHRTASKTISNSSKLLTTEQLSCKRRLHKEDIYIKKNINTLVLRTNGENPPKVDKRNPDISFCLEALTTLLGYKPTKESLNRFAIKRLITKLGSKEKVVSAINFAFKVRSEDKYAPRIYNFIDLEEKLEHLKSYGRQSYKSKAIDVEAGIAYLERKKSSVTID